MTSAARFQLSSLTISVFNCRESTRRGRSSLDSLGVLECFVFTAFGSKDEDDSERTPRFVETAEASDEEICRCVESGD